MLALGAIFPLATFLNALHGIIPFAGGQKDKRLQENLIENGGTQAGDSLNYLQFGSNSNSFLFVDVEYNTSYQTWQATGGEGYQFDSYGTGLIKKVILAYNVIIAAGGPVVMSAMVHGGGAQNAGVAHDNYVDRTAANFWLYPGSFTGGYVYNNYNMKTAAIMPPS